MRYLITLILCLASTAAFAGDYKKEFEQLLSKENYKEAETHLQEWEQKDPGDAEVYVSFGQLYFAQATKRLNVVARKEQPGKEDIVLTDPETGEYMGSISEVTEYDAALTRKAIEYLEKGMRLAPQRLDIRFGITYMWQAIGEFPSQYKVLENALEYAKENPEKLRWGSGDLPEEASSFIPRTLHEYAIHYLEKENEEDDKKFLRIAELSVKYYPAHPYAFNDIAIYYSIKQDWQNTLKYLLKAHEIDRRDSLVMANIADIYLKLDDPGKAEEYYWKIIRLGADPEEVRYARERLDSLKQHQVAPE